MFLWVMALHVVAVISWMAGMLYLFRLYVYHAEESETVVTERLQVWERKLLNLITTPAMVVALLSGIAMLVLEPSILKQPWMHIKFTALLGMFACHGIASKYRRVLVDQPKIKPGKFFRIMNEVPTVLMIIIVIAVIVKPFGH
ncbi:MAG: hemJ [Cyanobacteria bacterium RYN_339]|nr:hemJ [Cyanobacteria bacterium RYN_339]